MLYISILILITSQHIFSITREFLFLTKFKKRKKKEKKLWLFPCFQCDSELSGHWFLCYIVPWRVNWVRYFGGEVILLICLFEIPVYFCLNVKPLVFLYIFFFTWLQISELVLMLECMKHTCVWVCVGMCACMKERMKEGEVCFPCNTV